MSDSEKKEIGSVTWMDLTIPNAEEVKNFYSKVVGWKTESVKMGDDSDFNMNTPESGDTIAGICHTRDSNADLPPQWLIYITVENLDLSISSCKELGGKIIAGPKSMACYGRYCVIEDPAGAVAALFEFEK